MKISMAGTGGLLLDMAEDTFDEAVQARIWAMARTLGASEWCTQAVPGVNNLLVTFDPLMTDAEWASQRLGTLWAGTVADDTPPAVIDVRVDYGGDFGEDLPEIASRTGLTEDEVIALHASGTYRVAAIGAMPGFVYLTGLDSRLAIPRRHSPRLRVEQGAVVIGGGHAGIMPCSAPSGWHILGRTKLDMFSPHRQDPLLLHLGDIVCFHDSRKDCPA
ncbi:allophanate hydrolase [Komagataeibacter intermedius AF2]|uniref:Allophanate hydrolase n=2 Tax=Komagataeibacter intermedius TaxID=66229 RepID=A0A0N1FBA6_9PROT|nr:allophanate hydrolase [Komagataeibacter intermedius AF2]